MAEANSQLSCGDGSIYMFAGKGGVGKTTCAAATALHLASLGQKTLAISTDAAPSLNHIYEVSDGNKPIRVDDFLDIAELGADEIHQMWDKKFGREVYEIFSAFVSVDYDNFIEFTNSMLPGLSDEFMVDYIMELKRCHKYQIIVWDTAPLGQTLALLKTPAMLVEHLRMAPRVYSKFKLGQDSRDSVMDILKRWKKLSADSVDFLRDEVIFNIVTIPEALAYEQLDGIFDELARFGFRVEQLIINNVIKTIDSDFLVAKAGQQRKYIEMIHDRFCHLKIVELPMSPYEIKGLARLKWIETNLFV
jgi:arsenite-transporting ATPase